MFDFHDALTQFLQAAVDPGGWDTAMETLAQTTNAFGVALFALDVQQPLKPRTPSLGPVFESYVQDGWADRDERYRLASRLQAGSVVTDLDYMTEEEINRHPYYQDFLAPHGLRWFAGVGIAQGSTRWSLALQRTIEQGPFSQAEIEALRLLSERLSSGLAFALAFGSAQAQAVVSTFEVSRQAAVLVERTGKVCAINAEAERHVRGPDLMLREGRLSSIDPTATARFERLLDSLIREPDSLGLSPPAIFPRLGRRPLIAYCVRVSSLVTNIFAPGDVVVVLHDPDRDVVVSQALLSSAFGLTAAEARLAVRLAAGHSLDAASRELAISYETARTQLKAVFQKTGTRRQSELVRLLNRLGPTS